MSELFWKPEHNARRLVAPLAIIFVTALVLMFASELVEEAFLPQLNKWESRAVTIFFASLLATVGAYVALRLQQTLHEGRERAEASLAEERRILRALMDHLPDNIYVKDVESRFVTMNQSQARIMGTSLEQAIGKTDFDFFPKDMAAQFYADEQAIIASGQALINHEEAITDSQGNNVCVLTTKVPLHDSQKRIIGLVGISRDITMYRQAQTALTEERNLLRTIIDCLPDPVFVKDRQSRILLSNKADTRALGMTPEQVVGKTDYDFFPKELAAQYYADEQAIMQSGEPRLNYEEPSVDPQGNAQWVLTTKVPLRDSQGKVIGLVGLNRDVTQQKKAEGMLRQAHDELEHRVEERTAELSRMNTQLRQQIAERERIEHELEQQRDFYFQVMNALGQGVTVTDDARRFVYLNPAFAQMLGYVPETLFGKTPKDVAFPEDYDQLDEVRAQRNAGQTSTYELRLRRADGSPVPVLVTGTPRREDGRVTGAIAVFTDLSERKQAEEALRRSEERFYKAFHANPLAIVISTLEDGRFVDTNESYLKMIGYSREEVIGRTVTEVQTWSDLTARPQVVQQLREHGSIAQMEMGIRTRSGEIRQALASLEVIELEGKPHILGMIHDFTERKQVENALRETNQTLQALIHASPLAIFTLDPDKNVRLWNPAAERLFGWQAAEVVGGPYPLIPEDRRDEFEVLVAHLMRGGVLSGVEVRRVKRDGTYVDISLSAAPLYDAAGHITGSISVAADITEQRKAVDALWLSEERYRIITELMSDYAYSYRVEPDGRFVHEWTTDDSFTRLTGYAPTEIASTLKLYHPDDQEQVGRDVAEAMQGKANHGEYRIVTKHGEVRWLHIRRHPIWDDQEARIVRFLGVAQDVTERRLAENAERDQRLLAEALRHTAAAVNSTLNLDEVLDRILTQVASVMPHDASTVMLIESGVSHVVRCRGYAERGLEAAVLSARLPLAETRNLQQMFDTGRPFAISDTHEYPYWVLAPETEWIRSQIAAPILVEGQVIGFISLNSATPGAFSDVHGFRLQAFADQAAIALQNARLYEAVRRHADELEQHVAERTAELERERAQLQTILDGMGEGVTGLLFDENHQVQRRYINQAMFRLLGDTAEEFDPRRYQPMSQDENAETIDQIVLERGLWQGEVRLRHRDGNEFDAALTVTRVDGVDGQAIGKVTIVRDISQEKALQDQRARFVAHASHELRTPITNLKTRLYLMRRQPEKIDEHLTVVEQVTERMKKLVEDLLDLSRLERGAIPLRREELDLSRLIANVIRVQQPEAERKRITLTCDLPETPLYIQADYERITQVVTNLVMNAINYTPEGGMIQVYINTETNDGADFVVVYVQDSGVGIAPDHLPHIFQPFYRVGDRAGGTGLGLSISREIVEMHDGKIQVESEVGRGSRFSLRFALVPAQR